ncbi:hypothetical protein ACTU44_21710 (plasmid) [Thalassospira sp. SM2505]
MIKRLTRYSMLTIFIAMISTTAQADEACDSDCMAVLHRVSAAAEDIENIDTSIKHKNALDITVQIFANVREGKPIGFVKEIYGCLIDGVLIKTDKQIGEGNKNMLGPCPPEYSVLPQRYIPELAVASSAFISSYDDKWHLYEPQYTANDWLMESVQSGASSMTTEFAGTNQKAKTDDHIPQKE